MSSADRKATVRPAFSAWPLYNARLRDRWTIEDLGEELRRPEWNGSWVHTRGWVIQRVFTHDVWHAAEVNESLGNAGLPQIDLWD